MIKRHLCACPPKIIRMNQSNCPNRASFLRIRGESISLLALRFILTKTKSFILIKKVMESVNNQGRFQETESISEDIFNTVRYLKAVGGIVFVSVICYEVSSQHLSKVERNFFPTKYHCYIPTYHNCL